MTDSKNDFLYDPSLAQITAAAMKIYEAFEGPACDFHEIEPAWRKVTIVAFGEEVLRAAYAAGCAERRGD